MSVAKDILNHKPPHLVGNINVMKLAVQRDTDSTLFKEAIVMDCYDGDFQGFYKTIVKPLLPEKKGEFVRHQLAFLKDIALGICELHELGYVHYDVKPKNVLYKRDEGGSYCFVLCDIEGACRPLKDQKDRCGNGLKVDDRFEYFWGKFKHTRAYATGHIDFCPPFHVDFEILTAGFRDQFKDDNLTFIAPLLAVFEDENKDNEAKIHDMSKLVDSTTASLNNNSHHGVDNNDDEATKPIKK
jgi:serine/threonine protein kinase